MLPERLIAAVALLPAAAAAHAGIVGSLPEPASVSLVFAVLAAVGLFAARQRSRRAAAAAGGTGIAAATE